MRTGGKNKPRSKTAGHSGYNGRGTGDGQAPQPSCGEQDGRKGTRGAGREGGGMDGLDKMGRGYSRGLCMVNITVPQMQKVSSGEISIWG